ncbi:MAG: polysaccharide biosynthesis tyrosine autokinase, partial [Gemmatimonadota bacterium]
PSRPIYLRVEPFAKAVLAVQERVDAGQAHRDASIIRLTCTAPAAAEAQELCRALSESYMSLRSVMQRAEATTAAVFLREQSERMKHRLAVAEDSLEAYGRRNQVVDLPTRARVEVQQLGNLQADRNQLEAERAALSSLMANLDTDPRGDRKYRDLASFPTFMQNRGVTSLVANLVQLENQRSELALRRTEQSPDLAALDERIAETERQVMAIATSYEHALGVQIRSLDRTLAQAGSRLRVIPTQEVELARLQRQVSLLEQLYGELQTRLREAEVAEAVNLPSVRVIDAASFPLSPTSPRTRLNLAVGLFLGGGLGLVLAFYRELTDTRLREPKEVTRQTGLPILSLIPALDRPGPILPVFRPVEGNGRGKGLVPARSREEELLVEAFGSLSADLRFIARTLDGRRLRSVAVTSAVRGEGKTLVACNLALARASSGASTLLVDADLRVGGVSRFFRLPSSAPGLCEVLTEKAEAKSVWQRLRVQNLGELWVVPSGAFTAEATGRLGPATMGELISNAGTEFDLVVIDTPPLNVITDAATIASMVDAVVIVVRRGRTDREALELTLQRLERASAHVIGVVLNDFEPPSYYSSYYDYARSDAG